MHLLKTSSGLRRSLLRIVVLTVGAMGQTNTPARDAPAPAENVEEARVTESTAIGPEAVDADAAGPPSGARTVAAQPPGEAAAVHGAPPGKKKGPTIELSIEEAIGIALDNNLNLRVAMLTREIQERQVSIEKAASDPYFNLGASYSRNRQPSASFLDVGGSLQPGVVLNPFDVTRYSVGMSGTTLLGTTYSLGFDESGVDRPLAAEGGLLAINPQEQLRGFIQITQPLLRGGWYDYNTANIRIASNNESISREDLELTANNLVYDVEAAYWTLVFSIENMEAKTKALEVTEENVSNARKKRAAGTLADIDVVTAESQLALRKVEHNEAQLLLEEARDALLDLLNHGIRQSLRTGWESGQEGRLYRNVIIVPTTGPVSEPFAADRGEALRSAFENRPDYRKTAFQLENQRIQLAVSRNELLPFLDVTGSWAQEGLDGTVGGAFDSMVTGQFYSWTVGIDLRVPLSNRGPRNAFLKAREEVRRLQLERLRVENSIVLEVDQVLRRLRLLFQRVQDLERRVELQLDLLGKERKKLDVGKSIPYTVSTIENDLVDSAAQALRAKADYQTAKAEYYRVTGTILRQHALDSLFR